MGRIAEPPETAVPSWKRNWKLWSALILLVLPAVLLVAYTWLTLHYSYSSGERAGYVQKISKKGWLCKTWEGELAMTTVPGTAPQIFAFSVRDDATARRMEQAAGQRVALAYQQHKGVPSSCFAETEYFVTGVRVIGP
jgi:4-amino-4-deoxy-L-arabinose transferase-like glycosyltransferase